MSANANASPSGESHVRQALVPGLYAWGVSLAPLLISDAPVSTRACAALPFVAMGVALYLEARPSKYAIHALLWGMYASLALTLVLTPARLLHQFDLFRGVLATLGWGLFAYTCAAPALGIQVRPRASLPRTLRSFLRRIVLFVVPAVSVALLAFGWEIPDDERATLVHCAGCVLSLAILGRGTAERPVKRALLAIAVVLALTCIWLVRTARDVPAAGVAAVLSMLLLVSRPERTST
jgi:hypothetical protein